MNIVDYTNKFQEIEIKNGFFTCSDQSGLNYWDIVRYDVFQEIYQNLSNDITIKLDLIDNTKKSRSRNLYRKITQIAKFFRATTFKKYKYLCFVCSRYKNSDALNFDIASNDIVSRINKDSLIFESYRQEEKYLHSYVYDFGLSLEIYKYSFMSQTIKLTVKEELFKVSSCLKQEFNVDIDLDKYIYNIIERYKIELEHFIKLFTRLSPQAIFVVQNGTQKGMFAAANELNIPLIELQHGLIGYIHPSYSYPRLISKGQLKTLPKYFFSFSTFWTKHLNLPVQEIIPTGNSYFAKKIDKGLPRFEITFILADIYTNELIPLVDKLISSGFKEEICIKLHSNQYYQYEGIKKHFERYKFIEIIRNEKSIETLLSISNSILAIQSTCVYQALYNNVLVLLYKKQDYQTHEDVFNNPLLKLFDSAEDIIKILNEPKINPGPSQEYFKDFDWKLVESFLISIENSHKN